MIDPLILKSSAALRLLARPLLRIRYGCARMIPLFGMALVALLLPGCLTNPVEKSGGPGSVTVSNSNSAAIIAAAQRGFPQYGYSTTFGGEGNSGSFDKESNKVANVLWGSYGDPQTIRVKVKIVQIPGTNNYRISPKVYTVSNRGEAGFESKRALIGLWGSEFGPLLKKVADQASGANGGPE